MSKGFTVTLPVAWATFHVEEKGAELFQTLAERHNSDLLAMNTLIAHGLAKLVGETEMAATFYAADE